MISSTWFSVMFKVDKEQITAVQFEFEMNQPVSKCPHPLIFHALIVVDI